MTDGAKFLALKTGWPSELCKLSLRVSVAKMWQSSESYFCQEKRLDDVSLSVTKSPLSLRLL